MTRDGDRITLRPMMHTSDRPMLQSPVTVAIALAGGFTRFLAFIVAIATGLDEALERGRQRRVLSRLEDHRLRDIGITRAQARAESRKPFWKR